MPKKQLRTPKAPKTRSRAKKPAPRKRPAVAIAARRSDGPAQEPLVIAGVGASAGRARGVLTAAAGAAGRARAGHRAGPASRAAARERPAGAVVGRTHLQVVQAAEGMRVERNRVYVIPPNVQMGITGRTAAPVAASERSQPVHADRLLPAFAGGFRPGPRHRRHPVGHRLGRHRRASARSRPSAASPSRRIRRRRNTTACRAPRSPGDVVDLVLPPGRDRRRVGRRSRATRRSSLPALPAGGGPSAARRRQRTTDMDQVFALLRSAQRRRLPPLQAPDDRTPTAAAHGPAQGDASSSSTSAICARTRPRCRPSTATS